jgi:hypothetical protein
MCGPTLADERALDGASSGHRIGDESKDGEATVALAARAHHLSAVLLDELLYQRVVAR